MQPGQACLDTGVKRAAQGHRQMIVILRVFVSDDRNRSWWVSKREVCGVCSSKLLQSKIRAFTRGKQRVEQWPSA